VWCQQLVDGEAIDPEYVVASDLSDDALLAVKAASAERHGWDVEWLTPTSFVARKVRWSPDQLCERVFEAR
jgi:hypothetical protein